ncbi:Helitron helicase [Phytophthora megakarya]|uniref:Helitron helicase n=1 Tax=Phytophthora megakarya TaxID=4795 RepID=A0A225VID6_9STRA|nr:Helitron helicase [Phytophthora megakarya]
MLLRDHIVPTATSGLSDVGTHAILSSSFPGSKRYMRLQYYDAMAVVRQFGKPDSFVTVTTNPKWKEIQDELLPDAHILIILKDHRKPRNSSDYDKIVSAEIPDPELFPELHTTVTTCMIHCPCCRGIQNPAPEKTERRKHGLLNPYNE